MVVRSNVAAPFTGLTSGSQVQLVVDGVLIDTSAGSGNQGFNVNFSSIGSALGTLGWDYNNDEYLGGAAVNLAEFYLNTVNWLDLSNPSNVALFRNPSTGLPVSLGSNGSLPTNSVPAIYLTLPATGSTDQFAANNGAGGSFVISGTLSRAAGPS